MPAGDRSTGGAQAAVGDRDRRLVDQAIRPDVPIIMITAYGDAETKRRALASGAEALLTKPIDFGTLRGKIDSRVESAA